MKLSEKIKLLRTADNLTQPELAQRTGIEQSYLSKLENDKGTPSYEVINKIAQAFDLTGMELINSLSQSYIEQNLSHIPEVAAEYASIRHQQNQRLKRRFVLASIVVVLGVGLFFMGGQGILFSENEYIYQSPGVIAENETIYQYQTHSIDAISETQEESKQRIRSNRNRLDMDLLTLPTYAGEMYIVAVAGGKRVYRFTEVKRLDSLSNDLISILGLMMIVSGFFMFAFGFKFKSA